MRDIIRFDLGPQCVKINMLSFLLLLIFQNVVLGCGVMGGGGMMNPGAMGSGMMNPGSMGGGMMNAGMMNSGSMGGGIMNGGVNAATQMQNASNMTAMINNTPITAPNQMQAMQTANMNNFLTQDLTQYPGAQVEELLSHLQRRLRMNVRSLHQSYLRLLYHYNCKLREFEKIERANNRGTLSKMFVSNDEHVRRNTPGSGSFGHKTKGFLKGLF